MLIGIRIRTISDESFQFDLEHDTTIYAIKTKLKESTAIPEDRQRLIYKGHVLEDEKVIEDYRIEDGHTIHMVARPADHEELQRRREATASTSSSGGSSVSGIGASSLQTLLALSSLSGGSSVLGAGRGQATSDLAATDMTEERSLEGVRQGLLTAHTVMSCEGDDATGRDFYLGQWLDVKDTVNQWLEATIMDINHESRKIFVHYNGWPPRWDEWIDFSSDRLTLFRTRTANVTTSQASPLPSNQVPSAPVTGPADVRHLLPELSQLVNSMQPLLQEAALLCARDRQREEEEKCELHRSNDEVCGAERRDHGMGSATTPAGTARGMPWLQSMASSVHPPPCTSPRRPRSSTGDDEKDDIVQGLDFSPGLNEKEDLCDLREKELRDREQLVRVTSTLAPLLDRLGRAMTDSATHLHSLVATMTPRSGTEDSVDGSSNSNGSSTRNRDSRDGTADVQQGESEANSSVLRLLESMTHGASHSQQARSLPSQYRPLVSNPSAVRGRGAGLLGGTGGNHLDIHIHAIVAPTRGGAPTVLGDTSGVTTSATPVPPPSTLTPTPPRMSTNPIRDNAPSIALNIENSNERNSLSSSSSDEGPALRTLMREEEEEELRRRQRWSVNRGGSGSSVGEALQDDIEEIYDSNFGEHFRRLREGDSAIRSGMSGGNMEVDRCLRDGSTNAKASASVKDNTGGGVMLHDDADSTSISKVSSGSSARQRDPVHMREYAMLADGTRLENTNSSTGVLRNISTDSSLYGASSMPATYSQCGAKTSRNRGGGCEIDALTLSNLEKEVALLSEQTQQHGYGNGLKDAEEVMERQRREESLSFVQRVRRRLSFQQKSSSKDKKAKTKGDSSSISASRSSKQSSRKSSTSK
mmetsp:Transcript_15581/g.25965  ORF Transcript_15581/g.25965 Transcript_15581/m.25965 type:complete len:871 (+) Transcript_15581:110-2722(+)